MVVLADVAAAVVNSDSAAVAMENLDSACLGGDYVASLLHYKHTADLIAAEYIAVHMTVVAID